MTKTPTRLLAVAILAVLLGACGGGDRPAPPTPGPEVATVLQDDAELLYRDPARVAATLDDLRDLGVDWVRITAQWYAIQPERDVEPNWAALDQAVRLATDRGLEVELDIAFGPPDWATLADYPDYAAQVAARYPQAVAFTVWNEPNHPVFLDPQWRREGGRWVPESPDLYRRMLYDAVPRIRAAAPDALVLIGGLSSLGDEQGSSADSRMSPLTFLRALACVDEDLEPVRAGDCADFRPLPGDGFSHHPYSGSLPPWEHDADDPGSVRIADLDRLRSLLDALFERDRLEEPLPLYLTEYGYQTNPPDPTWDVTPAEAARWLAEAEELARAEPTVRSVAHFLYRDLPKRDGTRNPWGDFQTGLLFESGEPKPTRAAFALPLVARRVDGGVRFWGLVRPGEGEREGAVEVRRGGVWETLFETTTEADGTFERVVEADPDATFRLVSGSVEGAPLVEAR